MPSLSRSSVAVWLVLAGCDASSSSAGPSEAPSGTEGIATGVGTTTSSTGLPETSGDSSSSAAVDTSSSGGVALDVPAEAGACGCSDDETAVLDCGAEVLETCGPLQRCHPSELTCIDACAFAAESADSVGCEFFATYMDNARSALDETFVGCFAVAVANDWHEPVEVGVRYRGMDLDVASFSATFTAGGALTVWDPTDGLGPGEVAMLFLSGGQSDDPDAAGCPFPTAVPEGVVLPHQTEIGDAFEINTTAPVAAFQFNPYGGGAAAITGASLLLPTTAWGTEYLGINAAGRTNFEGSEDFPSSMNIVASRDDTVVTFTANHDVEAGGPVPETLAGESFTVTLDRGEHLQLTQFQPLFGSTIEASDPVGFMAGHSCMFVPSTAAACDHGEQMIPPVSALGHRYAVAPHRPRGDEGMIVRVIGVIDGTELSYTEGIDSPTSLNAGQVRSFNTREPFVVNSQDANHPFILATYMAGSGWNQLGTEALEARPGDPEMVLGVPVEQYRDRYTFVADGSYPETNLVVIRNADEAGVFADVQLDCHGTIDGWAPFPGNPDAEWTRFDLSTGSSWALGCAPGHQRMTSEGRFSVSVWGWGSIPQGDTGYVSYGFPAGMQLGTINDVPLPQPG